MNSIAEIYSATYDKREAERTRRLVPRPYFTLVVRDGAGEPWGIHFGDYSREVVAQELEDGRDYYARRDMRIIRTPDAKQATIDAAVAKLNAKA